MFLDMKQAFDFGNHQILLQNLTIMVFVGPLFGLLICYSPISLNG